MFVIFPQLFHIEFQFVDLNCVLVLLNDILPLQTFDLLLFPPQLLIQFCYPFLQVGHLAVILLFNRDRFSKHLRCLVSCLSPDGCYFLVDGLDSPNLLFQFVLTPSELPFKIGNSVLVRSHMFFPLVHIPQAVDHKLGLPCSPLSLMLLQPFTQLSYLFLQLVFVLLQLLDLLLVFLSQLLYFLVMVEQFSCPPFFLVTTVGLQLLNLLIFGSQFFLPHVIEFVQGSRDLPLMFLFLLQQVGSQIAYFLLLLAHIVFVPLVSLTFLLQKLLNFLILLQQHLLQFIFLPFVSLTQLTVQFFNSSQFLIVGDWQFEYLVIFGNLLLYQFLLQLCNFALEHLPLAFHPLLEILVQSALQLTHIFLFLPLQVNSIVLDLLFQCLILLFQLLYLQSQNVSVLISGTKLMNLSLILVSLRSQHANLLLHLISDFLLQLVLSLLPLTLTLDLNNLLTLLGFPRSHLCLKFILQLSNILLRIGQQYIVLDLVVLGHPQPGPHFGQLVVKDRNIIFQPDDFSLVKINVIDCHLDGTVITHQLILQIMIKITAHKYLLSHIHNYPFSSTQVVHHTKRGKYRPQLTLDPGQEISPFQLTHKKYHKDFNLTHLQLTHKQHQNQLHQLECDEENNTLSIVFRTQGGNKPALNFALQKLLLCGSKKYPVRNLMNQISKRSFSLITQPQSTQKYLMFSFNTPILKDFNNLFKVYSSMLFDPLMRQQDFYEVVRRLTYQNQHLGFTGELASQIFSNQFNTDRNIYSLISQHLLGERHNISSKPLDLLDISFAEVMKHYKQVVTIPNCTFILHGDLNIHHFVDQFNRNMEQFKPSTHKPIFYSLNENSTQQPDKRNITFQHLNQETILMLSYKIDNPTEEEATLLQILSFILFDMPESPFLKFNTPETPYPNLYGYHQRYFNIGITFFPPQSTEEKHMETSKTFRQRQQFMLQKQRQLLQLLSSLVRNKISNKLIEKCLLHLENNYYQNKGQAIIESITEKILSKKSISSVFDVTALINKLLRNYRKENVFQNLIEKYIIKNDNFIVLRGIHNPNIIDKENYNNQVMLAHIQKALPSSQLQQLASYSPPNYLQNFNSLPQINPSQLQIFEDTSGQPVKISNINTTFSPRYHNNRFTLKFDLTDIGEQDIPLLSLFCKAFPQMGYTTVSDKVYQALLQTYIGKLEMNYETVKNKDGQLKIQVYLSIEFTNRNYQYAVNILSGLLTQFNHNNLSALSRSIHGSASQCFNQISQDILHYHGLHLAASQSPFLFFENPLFQARTLCGLSAQMKKVHNPKHFLMGLGFKMKQIWNKMIGWSRMEVLWQCHPQKKQFYQKYLNIILSQIKNEGIPPASIPVDGFPKQKWQKYFPNYADQLAFQSFSVPYRQKNSPEALVLSSIINQNIKNFNKIGGCFLYKGALVSFIAGSRTKFIQLEQYYKKIDNIDVAKRRIFQNFNRYSVEQQFKTGIGFSQARMFKQAVISVQKQGIEQVLHECILTPLKQGNSSVLCLGGRLQNYQPLMKKQWEIQRSIQDLSLNMESLSKTEIHFEPTRYVDIC